MTVKSVDKVSLYKYLKNGAMTSIGILGLIIIAESFGLKLPEFLPTLITLIFVGVAFWESHRLLKKQNYAPTAI